eukprot:CAMPEP_0184299264 /NCGR_PEP_ID=MMETSP1049-20130417/9903_1 /TAXON_ID=77928 /ORGANISM="Proteomonas sulcata, Strain CCMP704" /LENGTH=349 /DNA_ID=CAMNT_0026609645 /DNA_START=484 /DNA_END=1533 /DNA_ORIENTATION=+
MQDVKVDLPDPIYKKIMIRSLDAHFNRGITEEPSSIHPEGVLPLAMKSKSYFDSSQTLSSDCALQAQQASGVYSDYNRFPGQVVVTAANWGYYEILQNWMCHADRFLWKYLIVALDNTLYQQIQQQFPDKHVCTVRNGNTGNLTAASEFREKQFNALSCLKTRAVADILGHGYSVWFLDVDVRWKSDIWPSVYRSSCDYSFQVNKPKYVPHSMHYKRKDEGNTGVYYAKSTVSIRRFFRQFVDGPCTRPGLDDQTLFWRSMSTLEASGEAVLLLPDEDSQVGIPATQNVSSNLLSFCPLDPFKFASGWSLRISSSTRRKLGVQLVHANYLKGKKSKVQMLKKAGYWTCR